MDTITQIPPEALVTEIESKGELEIAYSPQGSPQ